MAYMGHHLWVASPHMTKPYQDVMRSNDSKEKEFIQVMETSRVFTPGRIDPVQVIFLMLALTGTAITFICGWVCFNSVMSWKFWYCLVFWGHAAMFGFFVGRILRTIHTSAYENVTKLVYKEVSTIFDE